MKTLKYKPNDIVYFINGKSTVVCTAVEYIKIYEIESIYFLNGWACGFQESHLFDSLDSARAELEK